MTNCVYIIKLPKGREIKIPANFGLLSESDTKLVTAYKNLVKEKGSILTLSKLVKTSINESIPDAELSDLILDSVQNGNTAKQFIDTVNEIIPQNNEYLTFEKALYKYLLDNKTGEVSRLEQELDVPLTMEYVNGISGVVNQTSLKEIHSKLKSDFTSMNSYGMYSEILKEMNMFAKYVGKADPKYYEANKLLGNQSVLGANSSNIENYTVYNEDNMTSLFLGVFKRLGSELDSSILQKLGGEGYFDTVINEYGEILETPFERDLKAGDLEGKKRIELAVNSVAKSMTTTNTRNVKNTINRLLDILNPGLELIENDADRIKTNRTLDLESSFEMDFKNNYFVEQIKAIESDIDSSYRQEQKAFRNLDTFVASELSIGEDLVYFPDFENYGIISDFQIRDDGKIFIQGVRKSGNVTEYMEQLVSKNQELLYRKKETLDLDPAIEGENVQITEGLEMVHSQTGFPESLLKKVLRKGDTVLNGSVVITGLYTSHIQVRNKDGVIAELPYNQVKSFGSKLVSKSENSIRWTDYSHLDIVNTSDISQGDVIIDPEDNTIKNVIDADDKFVYVRRGNILASVPKSSIQGSSARRNSFESISNNLAQEFTFQNVNVINNYTKWSRFTDVESAKTGDYFVLDNYKAGKVVDIDTGKVIIHEGANKKVTTLDKVSVKTFFTKRPLISKFTPVSLRINNPLVHINTRKKDNYVEAMYVVPKDTSLDMLYMLPNNYANVGEWVEKKNLPSHSEVKDITSYMKSIIAKNEGIKTREVDPHLEKDGSYFVNDLTGIAEVKGFQDLEPDVKKLITPLAPGTHFRLFNSSSIYTIVEDRGKHILAERSSTTDEGSIVTEQKLLLRENLLQTHDRSQSAESVPKDAISNLYVQSNDPNQMILARSVEEDLELKEIKRINRLNKLKSNMAEMFKPLGIEVTESEEGFTSSQKAKITTENQNGLFVSKIVLNTKNGEYSDLVHENIHIQLTLLRHTNLNAYQELINSMGRLDSEVGSELESQSTITEKEEIVVNKLVDLSNGENTFLYSDLKGFMGLVETMLTEHYKTDVKFGNTVSQSIKFLNTRMGDLFSSKDRVTHPMYNVGIITAEPYLRAWMDENGIKIICK